MRVILALLALCASLPAAAINSIRVQAASVAVAGMQAETLDARLDIRSSTRSLLALRAARLRMAPTVEAQTGAITALHLQCTDPVIREPEYACPRLTLDATSTRWSNASLVGKARFNSDRGTLDASGTGLNIAGSPAGFGVSTQTDGWTAQLALRAIPVTQLRTLLAPYIALPADLTLSGTGALSLRAENHSGRTTAVIDGTFTDAGFQNTAYTWIGEKIGLAIHATADLSTTPLPFEMQLSGGRGQALAGPVLLDFGQNPLQLKVAGTYAPDAVHIQAFEGSQKNLAQIAGTAQLALEPFAITAADFTATGITFPAAYTSYLQLLLATTPFNQLVTTGTADAHVALRNDQPKQLDLTIRNLSFGDATRALQVNGVNSELHWSAGAEGPPRPSWLAWEDTHGWGLIGAKTRLDFVTSDRNFRLLEPARLPLFDGALLINTLAAENLGSDTMTGVFDASVEPISVNLLTRALGWPEFSGRISGRIPGLTYRNNVLTLQGNLETSVFDGRVVASNLRVRDPLSAWPRLYGDITARNLDLDLVTRTFEFGSITGRLDIDLAGLETFNWTPVAFNLRMATPAGDRSRHRISQRAVQNLSDIGGGGAGVAAALQSGALKFFDDFGYDRIGISCRLRRDVCLMAGVGNAKEGFYIVKGKALPRIDIIGNNRRVDWPLLVRQVRDALANPEGISVR